MLGIQLCKKENAPSLNSARKNNLRRQYAPLLSPKSGTRGRFSGCVLTQRSPRLPHLERPLPPYSSVPVWDSHPASCAARPRKVRKFCFILRGLYSIQMEKSRLKFKSSFNPGKKFREQIELKQTLCYNYNSGAGTAAVERGKIYEYWLL